MARSLSEAANYIIGKFDNFGMEIPEDSRIKSMYKSVCKDDGSSRGLIPETDEKFREAREALRDIRQFEFFFDQVNDSAEDTGYISVLKRAMIDSRLPEESESNTPGRDAQAELFAFAVCKNADLQPTFEEPDITCRLNGRKFGIAVKRIKNLSKIKTRLCKGAEQIHKSGLPGIISVEVTIAVNPENYSIVTNDNEQKVSTTARYKLKKMNSYIR